MAKCNNCFHNQVCDFACKRCGGANCMFFADSSRFVELPCKVGTHLFRVTKPYRGEPKVTEFVVKNFRTFGKRHQVQLEVQAVNVPGTNWMRYQDFYLTREEAEAELARRTANE